MWSRESSRRQYQQCRPSLLFLIITAILLPYSQISPGYIYPAGCLSLVVMTFAVLRALHTIIGDALNEIEGVYSAHGQSLEVIRTEEIAESSTETTALVSSPLSSPGTRGTDSHSRPRHKPALSNGTSYAYVSPPPSPCISSPPERIPRPLDHQSGSRTPALDLIITRHPLRSKLAIRGFSCTSDCYISNQSRCINRVVAATGQISATVQTPFLSLCDASMGVSRLAVFQQRTPSDKLLYPQYHLPSCMRILEASHIAEILREAGPPGLHIKSISEQSGIEASKLGQSLDAAMHMASTYTFSLAHILRLLATHHILREVTPDVSTTNRISSLIDSGKSARELSEFQASGWYVVHVFLNLYSNSPFALEDLSSNMSTQTG